MTAAFYSEYMNKVEDWAILQDSAEVHRTSVVIIEGTERPLENSSSYS